MTATPTSGERSSEEVTRPRTVDCAHDPTETNSISMAGKKHLYIFFPMALIFGSKN
jgi:hypothetical protein